jgi:hypothetical protein
MAQRSEQAPMWLGKGWGHNRLRIFVYICRVLDCSSRGACPVNLIDGRGTSAAVCNSVATIPVRPDQS